MTFTIGQRYISNSESQLGLGIITKIQGREVFISFPAAGEERIYACENSPLSRISYKEGDEISTFDQQTIKVSEVREEQGLLIYTGTNEKGEILTVDELDLDCFIKLIQPQQRLFSGQFDKLQSFYLRINTLNQLAKLKHSPVRGLLGSRTSHLPHQIYIAHEVAQRFAPRVLLADEVGLGKTIEAGMIIHYQLYQGRGKRILIVVPEALIHQWLVEMLRRFNLHFSIIDQGNYEEKQEANLFENEQLILCSLDFLLSNEEAKQQAIAANWDLLVVDEAHHLHWSERKKSPGYACIEQLAANSKGLLLITATPEQLGIKSHFARLRLLDPSRFYDFSAFQKEEAGFKKLNDLVQAIIIYQDDSQTDELTDSLKAQLKKYLGSNTPSTIQETIKQLIDRHGTGRVLFRNTRAAIQGFAERLLHAYPLPLPSIYQIEEAGNPNLCPETAVTKDLWLQNDPRVKWLGNKIRELRPEKVLVICASTSTAIALEQHLKLKEGIRSSAFHESLSIIERDRAAAYFSEQVNGAQVLVCSEIGSEGRNFQFTHHLVLFDLPLNPDLLEQRIGRLDRIGQRFCIEIHVPYLEHSAQQSLFRWLHEGLNLFERSCSVAYAIYERFAKRLLPLLSSASDQQSRNKLDRLIRDTKKYTEQIMIELNEGRDRLLELNSCNNKVARKLIAAIETAENSLELENYMAAVFEEFGIEHEYHSESCEILRPTDHMKISHFPGLKEDGITVTYSRAKALIREEMEFLSWEHPIVSDSMEMISDSELGNVSIVTISIKGLMPGTLLLETFYTVNCAAPKELQLDQFLTSEPIRVLTDFSGKNLTELLAYNQLNSFSTQVNPHRGPAVAKKIRPEVEIMLKHSNKFAEQQMELMVKKAKKQMKKSLGEELVRLKDLQKINSTIRDEEISYCKEQIIECENYLNHAALKLQALRVVINN